jgi:hypothetical protein
VSHRAIWFQLRNVNRPTHELIEDRLPVVVIPVIRRVGRPESFPAPGSAATSAGRILIAPFDPAACRALCRPRPAAPKSRGDLVRAEANAGGQGHRFAPLVQLSTTAIGVGGTFWQVVRGRVRKRSGFGGFAQVGVRDVTPSLRTSFMAPGTPLACQRPSASRTRAPKLVLTSRKSRTTSRTGACGDSGRPSSCRR